MSAAQPAGRAWLPRQAWPSVALLLAVLTIVNFALLPDQRLELSNTSYGKSIGGFGAVYDLLDELGMQVSRSRAFYDTLDVDRPLWLLEPSFARFEPWTRAAPEASTRDDEALAALMGFVSLGGTAVIVGPDAESLERLELSLGPPRTLVRPTARGPLSPHPRALHVSELALFESSEGFETLLELDGQPFAVLQEIGAGVVVVVSDARPFANQVLAEADHSLLAVDLARAFGAPRFDERSHGLLADASLTSAIGGARLALLGATLALVLLVLLLRARRLPARAVVVAPGPDPSLAGFVESLAALYGRKGPSEPAAVYRAYVHGFRHRLRRRLYGNARSTDELLSARLARELGGDPALRAWIEGQRPPATMHELQGAVERMERHMAAAGWHSPKERA